MKYKEPKSIIALTKKGIKYSKEVILKSTSIKSLLFIEYNKISILN